MAQSEATEKGVCRGATGALVQLQIKVFSRKVEIQVVGSVCGSQSVSPWSYQTEKSK